MSQCHGGPVTYVDRSPARQSAPGFQTRSSNVSGSCVLLRFLAHIHSACGAGLPSSHASPRDQHQRALRLKNRASCDLMCPIAKPNAAPTWFLLPWKSFRGSPHMIAHSLTLAPRPRFRGRIVAGKVLHGCNQLRVTGSRIGACNHDAQADPRL